MNSGTVTTGSVLVGRWGPATLNMTGGTIITTGTITIAEKAASIGHVNLDGGTISGSNITMRSDEGAVGTMNITAGTLILDGNDLSTVQGLIDNGWITAYDGNGTLQLNYDDVANQTTLTAVHNLNPNPADGGSMAPGATELSWTLPDPLVPSQPVSVDVYFTDNYDALAQFTDPAAIQVVSKKNATSVVDPNDPNFGPIFSFVVDNIAPIADAGSGVATWLEAGTRTGSLNGSVIETDAYTVQWTVVSEPDDPNSPDAVIADPSAEDTSITLSAVGEYILQLEADDGEYIGSDTVTINVYNDSCEAAQSLPDYVPFPGDVNGDCIFDQLDLDILNEDWLKDNSLTEVWFQVN